MTDTKCELKPISLSPRELALLLDLDPVDIAPLAVASVRLPAEWVHRWKSRTGPQELTVEDAAMLTGAQSRAVRRWITDGWLQARRCGAKLFRISPAALLACLKKQQGEAKPEIVLTPSKVEKKHIEDQERARKLLGDAPSPRNRKGK